MYTLTISTPEKLLRVRSPVSAFQAIRDWFEEETTGYLVACLAEDGTPVTRGQLRAAAQQLKAAQAPAAAMSP